MSKKIPKRYNINYSIFLYVAGSLIALWLVIGFFLFYNKMPSSIYISTENPRQGDTVFIRVKSEATKVTGNFGEERLNFYKKGNSTEWLAFLGIDVDQNPGNYKIFVDTSNAEHLVKEIKINLADFSSAVTAVAPSVKKGGITSQKAADNIIRNDNPAIKKYLSNPTAQPYFTAPFSFPLSTMKVSGFSFGKFIGFTAYKLQHLGVDLRAPEKTEIYSVNDGKVVATLDLANYGKTVIIDHGLNIFSMYLHLDQFKVSEGEMVRRGQTIGLSGDTGYSTAPHLHFSMRVDGSRVDPVEFIDTTQKMNDNLVMADITNAFLNLFNLK